MNRPNLISEVFGADESFRSATLGQILAAARRRRIKRSTTPAGLLLAVVIGGLMLLPRPKITVISQHPRSSVLIIASEPLKPSQLISTKNGELPIVETAGHSVALIETKPGLYRNLDDESLLALLANHPAALIRKGLHEVQLVFVNKKDQDGFVLQ